MNTFALKNLFHSIAVGWFFAFAGSSLYGQDIASQIDLAKIFLANNSYDDALKTLLKYETSEDFDGDDLTDAKALKALSYFYLQNYPEAKASALATLEILEQAEAELKAKYYDQMNLMLAKVFSTEEDYESSISYSVDSLIPAKNNLLSFRTLCDSMWRLVKGKGANYATRINDMPVSAKSAFACIKEAREKHNQDFKLVLDNAGMLIHLELYNQAFELVSSQALGNPKGNKEFNADEQDFIEGINYFNRSETLDYAVQLATKMQLAYPKSEPAYLILSNLYMQQGKAFAAASIMESLARLNDKYYLDASELYRRAGHLVKAKLLMNFINPGAEKLKMQLALLVELQEFGQIISLENEIYRSGLSRDGNIMYALAFSYFQIKDFAKARTVLSQINDSSSSSQVAALQEVLFSCESELSRCENIML